MVVAVQTEGWIPVFGWAWNLLLVQTHPQSDYGNKGVSKARPSTVSAARVTLLSCLWFLV